MHSSLLKEERLASLASGLCQDASIEVEVRDEDSWSWDPWRRVITVPSSELNTKGDTYCAGVIAHEVGHFFISRYLHFSETDLFPKSIFLLLNALEDGRVEDWICKRYSGTCSWIKETAEDNTLKGTRTMLDFLLFCMLCVVVRYKSFSQFTISIPENVRKALKLTELARNRYVELQPNVNFDLNETKLQLRNRYKTLVFSKLKPGLQRGTPDSREQIVLLSAYEAFELARREIIPIASKLLAYDEELLANAFADSKELHQKAEKVLSGDADPRKCIDIYEEAKGRVEFSTKPNQKHKNTASGIIDLILGRVFSSNRGTHTQDSNTDSLAKAIGVGTLFNNGIPPGFPSIRFEQVKKEYKKQPLPNVKHTLNEYEKAYYEIEYQIEEFTGRIQKILQPRRKLSRQSGFVSGSRIDLRRLMQFNADPRRYGELWCRNSLPDRRDAAILLLVDVSGSMHGAKAHSALLGTILLAECLARLVVPFAVFGFQDQLIKFLGFDEVFDSKARKTLGELPMETSGSRPGGHNEPGGNDDGPCLLEASEQLLERSEYDRVLIVICDGLPNGSRSSEKDLQKAIEDLSGPATSLELIGVGLGSNTEQVTTFYPESIANVPVNKLAQQIGNLLESVLLRNNMNMIIQRSSE